jgi:hypothetical protein
MSITPTNPRDTRAPEGARCAEHPERPALFTCPHCGGHACVVCFHPAIERCQRCLKRDPTEAAPPLPWEREGEPAPKRYLRTLATAFSPVRSAPAFAREEIAAARRFLLLSALPFALLAGIVPHTRTLLFAGSVQVKVLGTPQPGAVEIALDVLRAMGVQLGLSAIECACVALPFVSLCRAYAPERAFAALRSMYYRLWLLPASLLGYYAVLFMAPMPASPTDLPALPVSLVLFGLRTLLPVLLFVAMGSTARLACGIGPWLSMVVVMVPVALSVAVKPFADEAATHLLPALEAPANAPASQPR